jgi:enoyl-CoA hydratase
MTYKTLSYGKDPRNGRIARIKLNRPQVLNAITPEMPGEIRRAVEEANADDEVHVIILEGEGRAFCAGYDLKYFAEAMGENPLIQEEMPWDPMQDFRVMKSYTDDFMSLWRSYKPTICKVQQYAVAGGTDMALCCDLIIVEDKAKLGYPPTRVWGCPTTGLWTYRVGAMRAKRMLFTGDLIDGITARDWGLAIDAVPLDKLDETVDALAERIAGVPRNQLMMHKLVVNQSMSAMGVENTQIFATLFDGITRHSPEGVWFKAHAERHGFHDAIRIRDSNEAIPEGDEARAAVRRLRNR